MVQSIPFRDFPPIHLVFHLATWQTIAFIFTYKWSYLLAGAEPLIEEEAVPHITKLKKVGKLKMEDKMVE